MGEMCFAHCSVVPCQGQDVRRALNRLLGAFVRGLGWQAQQEIIGAVIVQRNWRGRCHATTRHDGDALELAMARDPTAPARGCVGVVVGDWRGDKRL